MAAAPRSPDPNKPGQEGAVLVMQYIEGYVYRTYGLRRAGYSNIEALCSKARQMEAESGTGSQDPEDYPMLETLMKACQQTGYVCNGTGASALDLEVGYIKNQINDLKYFIRQYGQLIIETKLTTSTYNQYDYTIAEVGEDLGYDEYSKGFIAYGYNGDYMYIQNTLGPFAGMLGFHRVPWSIVPQLVYRGACWRLRNPS